MAKKENTSKEISVAQEEDAIAIWKSAFSGGKNTIPMIYLDNTKLDKEGEKNENFGKIYAVKDETKEELVVGDSFLPVMRRVQVGCRDFIEVGNKKKAEYWCRETNVGENIELRDVNDEIVYQGSYKDAKEKYNLRYKEVIYAYWNSNIYRWKISGQKTLGSWFAVVNEQDKIGCPHYIKIKTIEPESNNGIFWNNLYFELGEKADLAEWSTLYKKLSEALNTYYENIDKKTDMSNFVEDEKKDTDLPF